MRSSIQVTLLRNSRNVMEFRWYRSSRVVGPKDDSEAEASLISCSLLYRCHFISPGFRNSDSTRSRRADSRKLSKTLCGNGFAFAYDLSSNFAISAVSDNGREDPIHYEIFAIRSTED